jgi:hypothetical protein
MCVSVEQWYGYREREGWGRGSEWTNGCKGNSIKNIGPVTLWVSVEQWYGYREREGWGRGSEWTNGSKGNSVKNIGPVTLLVSVEQWYGYREREGWDRGSEQTSRGKGSSVNNIWPCSLWGQYLPLTHLRTVSSSSVAYSSTLKMEPVDPVKCSHLSTNYKV